MTDLKPSIMLTNNNLSTTEFVTNVPITNDTSMHDAEEIRKHRLYPAVEVLLTKLENCMTHLPKSDSLSTADLVEECSTACSRQSTTTSTSSVDQLMENTVAQYSAQLGEMAKLDDLCNDFCRRFSSSIRHRLHSDVLSTVAGESDEEDVEQLMQARGLTMAYMDNGQSVGVNGPKNHKNKPAIAAPVPRATAATSHAKGKHLTSQSALTSSPQPKPIAMAPTPTTASFAGPNGHTITVPLMASCANGTPNIPESMMIMPQAALWHALLVKQQQHMAQHLQLQLQQAQAMENEKLPSSMSDRLTPTGKSSKQKRKRKAPSQVVTSTSPQ